MAKNAPIDSLVTIVDETQVRFEGELVTAGEKIVIFKAKKRGGQRFIQRSFPRDQVVAVANDFIIIKQRAPISTKTFRPIKGTVDIDPRTGWYTVDGIQVNPTFATVEADLGTAAAGATKAKGDAPKKKKSSK